MVILFVGWAIFMAYCMIRFRWRQGARAIYKPIKAKLSGYIEVAVVIFEAFLLVGLSIPAWSSFKHDFPKDDESYHVRVVSQQFIWNFHYPGRDGIFGETRPDLVVDAQNENPLGLNPDDPAALDDLFSQNHLHIPVGRNVIAYLSSKDVIHSLGIHKLSVKQDILPGGDKNKEMRIWFVSEKTSHQIQAMVAENHPMDAHRLVPGLERFNMVTMEDKGGIAKGTVITENVLEGLRKTGAGKILAAPEHPVEVACSQLCGLGHYRMRAFVHILPEDELRKWEMESLRDNMVFTWDLEDIPSYLKTWSKPELKSFMATWGEADIDEVFQDWSLDKIQQVFKGWSRSELRAVFRRG